LEEGLRASKEQQLMMEARVREKEDETTSIKETTGAEIHNLNEKIDLLQRNLDNATSLIEKLSNFKSKDAEASTSLHGMSNSDNFVDQSGDTQIDPEMAKKQIAMNFSVSRRVTGAPY
jgi:hypothetical protein